MAFKGVDLAIYSVFQALGLKVGIHPTIENRSQIMGGLSAKDLMKSSSRPDGDHVENCLAAMAPRPDPNWDEDDPDDYREDEYSDEEEERTTIVGTKLHGPTFDESYEEESREVSLRKLGPAEAFNLIHCLFKPVSSAWPHQKVGQILWMNEPTHKDFAYAGLAVSVHLSRVRFWNELSFACPVRKRGFSKLPIFGGLDPRRGARKQQQDESTTRPYNGFDERRNAAKDTIERYFNRI